MQLVHHTDLGRAEGFKIQTAGVVHWEDLHDQGEVEVFDTREAAEEEMAELQEAFPDTGYQVVPANTPADLV